MSIKIKLPCFVLAMLLVNILLLGGYYRLHLSAMISENSNEVQQSLEQEAERLSANLKNRTDAARQLKETAESQHLLIEVVDSDGRVLLREGSAADTGMNHRASSLLLYGGKACLLRITKPIPLSHLSLLSLTSFDSVRSLFEMETLFLFLILLLSGVLIYLRYVRPIVSLEEKITRYRSGIRPERVARPDEIGQLQNCFADLTDAIEEERQKQEQIIASISHDIKTPLTSVMGYAERLKKSSLTREKHDQYVGTIYRKAEVIKNLLDEFDEYLSYHSSGSLKRQILTAETLCSMLRMDYGEELRDCGTVLSVTDGCPDAEIWVDLPKIRRVFGNMIDNSLKHRGERAPEIRISCREYQNEIIFEVADNGTGIKDQKKIDRIFDPFYTSDTARTFAGLGLSICKEIVEAHGGRIRAENVPEGGLRITFSLPREEKQNGFFRVRSAGRQ